MIRRETLRKLFQIHRSVITIRSNSSQINIQNLETDQEASEVIKDDEILRREEELEKKRNKSRLKVSDYKMLHEQNPYPEPEIWHHGSLKYIRRTYGRYGAASGVDPSVCWPIKKELQEAVEYEKVKYPYTIPQMIEEARIKKEEKHQATLQRQQEIVKKMTKLEQWKQELYAKIEKKENEAMEARLRRERLIEEVRRHFGYTVDPRDDRFKELLEKKEKEQKKVMKEARRKAKEAEVVSKLLNKNKKEKQEDFPSKSSENVPQE